MATSEEQGREKIDQFLKTFNLITQDRIQRADGKKMDAEIRKNLNGFSYG